MEIFQINPDDLDTIVLGIIILVFIIIFILTLAMDSSLPIRSMKSNKAGDIPRFQGAVPLVQIAEH
jgi:hypothetical protein